MFNQFEYTDTLGSTNSTTANNLINYLKKVKTVDYGGCERVKVIRKDPSKK